MQPLGRKKIRFPSKTKEFFGKGILMWWENVAMPNKKNVRQTDKKLIQNELK